MIKKREGMREATVEKPRDGEGVAHYTYVMEKDEMKSSCTMFAKITLEPGSRVGEHAHVEDAEVYYILEGMMEVNDNGTIQQARPGDAVYTSDGGTHSIKNIGDTNATMIAVIIR